MVITPKFQRGDIIEEINNSEACGRFVVLNCRLDDPENEILFHHTGTYTLLMLWCNHDLGYSPSEYYPGSTLYIGCTVVEANEEDYCWYKV